MAFNLFGGGNNQNEEAQKQTIRDLRAKTKAAGGYFPDSPVSLQQAMEFAKPVLQGDQALKQQTQGFLSTPSVPLDQMDLIRSVIASAKRGNAPLSQEQIGGLTQGTFNQEGGVGRFNPITSQPTELSVAPPSTLQPPNENAQFLESALLGPGGRAERAAQEKLKLAQQVFGNVEPGPLSEAAGLGGVRQQEKAGDRGFAPQVSTRYIPVADDQYQLMSIDEVSGGTKPVLKDGKPIILSEKQVLIAEGKKAQSLIDPYENKMLGKLGESEATRLTELKKSALEAVKSKKILGEGLVLVNSGIYTGAAANVKLQFNKWLQEAGIKVGNTTAANTEAYAGLMGLQVGQVIQAFGRGTGLSDADRDYAQKIAGGEITLTEESLRKLLDINKRLADFTISEYNRQAIEAKKALEEKDFFRPIENTPSNQGEDLSNLSTEELLKMLEK